MVTEKIQQKIKLKNNWKKKIKFKKNLYIQIHLEQKFNVAIAVIYSSVWLSSTSCVADLNRYSIHVRYTSN